MPIRLVLSAFRKRTETNTGKDGDILRDCAYDFSAMHKRACAAILVLNMDQQDVAERMGADMSIPLYLRKPFRPTMANICKAADIIGISTGWLMSGDTMTDTDDFVATQIVHINTINMDDLLGGDFDHVAINNRVYHAIAKTGRTLVDVAVLFGMDPTVPLRDRDPATIPRFTIATMVKLSDFLGVSIRWMLYGEPENEVDLFVDAQQHPVYFPQGFPASSMIAGVSGPTVVQKNDNCSKIIVKNIQGEELNEMEREALRFFRRLTGKRQAEALARLYKNYA